MESIERCDIGNVREINQDYVNILKINDHETLIIVCDGMGGHAGGEVASKLTGDYIINHFFMHGKLENDEDIKAWLHSLIHEANHLVYRKALENESLRGMGTTIVLMYVRNSDAYICHVGDSRAYLIDENIHQITSDDTLVNALVKNGTITALEARFHPKKNILIQAIGVTMPLSISFYKETIKEYALICSDGLYNSLSDLSILQLFHSSDSLDTIADKMLEQAKKYGGYDNIGFIILKKGEGE